MVAETHAVWVSETVLQIALAQEQLITAALPGVQLDQTLIAVKMLESAGSSEVIQWAAMTLALKKPMKETVPPVQNAQELLLTTAAQKGALPQQILTAAQTQESAGELRTVHTTATLVSKV